jgi:chaperonin GroEL
MAILLPTRSTTLGTKGRNVALDRKFGSPTITHDGVTVAKEMNSKILREYGRAFKKAPPRQRHRWDGTTPLRVGQAIVTKASDPGRRANPMLLKRGIEARQAVASRSRSQAIETPPGRYRKWLPFRPGPAIGELIAEVMDMG